MNEVVERERTVRDRLDGLAHWRSRVEESTEDYATPEWKLRVYAAIDRQEDRLSEFPDEMVLLNESQAMRASFITPVEKAAIRWQRRSNWDQGAFWAHLWEAISTADSEHLARLAAGYPNEVAAVRLWRSERGWADSLRGLPLAFEI